MKWSTCGPQLSVVGYISNKINGRYLESCLASLNYKTFIIEDSTNKQHSYINKKNFHTNHNNLINDTMACDAKLVMPVIIESCSETFDGLKSLLVVDGGNDTTMCITCPWIQAINFDLPHVIAEAARCDVVEHVCFGFVLKY
ncbi:(RS)-norcoclaurine 6-O-methyltransferase [Spatholobus suberectus]|nr:(RS)-norcoclaurine 6-O-methyltransferase [Spatholobus suberectus]